MEEPQQLGSRDAVAALGQTTLKLIAQRWVIAILLELVDEPQRPHELERRVPGLSHAGLMRRLAELTHSGVVTRTRSRDIPPRAYYALTRSGEELLVIADRAARWEEQTQIRSRTVPGAWALRTVADERSLEVIRALAQGPCGPRELGRRVPPFAHAALMRRLTALTADGLLNRHEQHAQVLYALAHDARGLAVLTILAMGWERARDSGVKPLPPSDLAGMLRVLASTAVLPERVRGACRLRVDAACERQPEVLMLAAGGSLRPLGSRSPLRPRALVHGPLDAWLRALLTGSPAALVTVADPPFAMGVVGALAAPLRARRLDSLFDLIKIA